MSMYYRTTRLSGSPGPPLRQMRRLLTGPNRLRRRDVCRTRGGRRRIWKRTGGWGGDDGSGTGVEEERRKSRKCGHTVSDSRRHWT